MTGGRLEEAGDRQLGHPLQSPPLIEEPSTPPAKACETIIIVITVPQRNVFMPLSFWPPPGTSGYKHGRPPRKRGSFNAWRQQMRRVTPRILPRQCALFVGVSQLRFSDLFRVPLECRGDGRGTG